MSITKLYPANAAENPDNVLEQAVGEYESAVIIGWNKEGLLDIRASTNLKEKDINWMIDHFKLALLDGSYED